MMTKKEAYMYKTQTAIKDKVIEAQVRVRTAGTMVRGKIFFALCLLLTFPAFSQNTADEIETLLETNAVTYAQAARFVLEAADVTVTADTAEAFQYVVDKNWLAKNVSADDTARLDRVALLIMRSFEIKGGIFYSIARNPHYAYRELVYQKIIQGRVDPAMTVSGDDLLYIINRVFSQTEEENQP